jgi:hypothetical protein
MSTHPHSSGGGGYTEAKMRKLLTFHEHAADAIRTTLGLLNGHDTATKMNGHKTVIAQALALDAGRAAKTKGTAAKKKAPLRNGQHKAAILAQRKATAKVLGVFDTERPTTLAAAAKEAGVGKIHVGPYLHRGYLRRKADGYVRTAKPYKVDAATANA